MSLRQAAIRVLLVEDDARDAELLLRELQRAGLKLQGRQVQTEADFRRAIAEFRPQIILSDFSMPQFDGMQALTLARELCRDTPFLFVSGTLGEEYAIGALKNGATDYVLKTNLVRLPPAVDRALQEARERAIKREMEQALQVSEAGLQRAQLMAGLAHVITGPDGSFESWSESLPNLIGVEPARMPRSTREWLGLLHPEDRALFRATSIEAGRRGMRMEVSYRLQRSDSAWIHIRQVMESIEGSADRRGRMRWFNTLQDVTGQKQAEDTLRASEERYRVAFEQAGVGVAHTSFGGDILIVNQKFCAMSGYARAEAVQLSIRDLTDSRDINASVDGRSRMLAGTGAPYERELRLIRKDGTRLWVSITTSLVTGVDGKPSYFISVVHDISERKLAEEAMRRFRYALDNSADMIFIIDRATMRYVDVNETACKLLGYAREELQRMGPLDTLPVTNSELEKAYDELIANPSRPGAMKSYYRCKDGSQLPFESTRQALRAGEGWIIVAISRDIRQRLATEQALEDKQKRIERLSRVYAVLSGINAAIVRIQDRQSLFEEVCRVAYDSGRFPLAWVGMVDRERKRVTALAWSEGGGDFMKALQSRLFVGEGQENPVALAVRHKKPFISVDIEGDARIVLKKERRELGVRSFAVLPLLVDGEAVGVFALHAAEAGFFDDEEMKLLQELAGDVAFALEHIAKIEKVDYLTLHDSLTGLANRTLLVERLGQSIRDAGQAGGKFAIAWVDLERLATVNESLGRQAGDALIKQVAGRFALVAGAANIARITGDEFVVVLPPVKGRSEASRVAADFARTCFAEPYLVEGNELVIAAKTGLALFPSDGVDPETLLANAEAALTKAKDMGERQMFYTPDLTERTGATLTLENKLRRALQNDEFVLHYQPKIDTETRRIVAMEALLRWQSPELGLVPPVQFIALMEQTGMILDVGTWALKRASLDHRRWTEQGIKPPRIAVNVSAIQLRQRDFVQAVEQAIMEGVAPTGIDLEITESLVMQDIEANIEKLKEVRKLGVEVAIDDFGTGYSSLSYLAKLPVQILKIDRSFIVAMLKAADTMSLVQTIISLAHSLKLKVVAEGVETEEQAKILQLLRCDQMQGYLFSKPLPSVNIETLLKNTEVGKPQ